MNRHFWNVERYPQYVKWKKQITELFYLWSISRNQSSSFISITTRAQANFLFPFLPQPAFCGISKGTRGQFYKLIPAYLAARWKLVPPLGLLLQPAPASMAFFQLFYYPRPTPILVPCTCSGTFSPTLHLPSPHYACGCPCLLSAQHRCQHLRKGFPFQILWVSAPFIHSHSSLTFSLFTLSQLAIFYLKIRSLLSISLQRPRTETMSIFFIIIYHWHILNTI